MAVQFIETSEHNKIAYEILEATEQGGYTFVLSPSLGDFRQEYRKITPLLYDNGKIFIFYCIFPILISLLSTGKNTVVAADLRGMGQSDIDFGSYEPFESGRDLIVLLNTINRSKVILVGCSMSAAAAVYASASSECEVLGVVLISAFLWDHAMPFGVRTLLSILLNSFTGPAFWSFYYKSLYTLKPSPVEDLVEYSNKLKTNLAEKGRIQALRGHIFGSKKLCDDRSTIVAEKKLPVYIVYGEKDPDFQGTGLLPEINGMKQRFPYLTEPLILTGCGHYPHVEQPAAVATGIFSFLGTIKG